MAVGDRIIVRVTPKASADRILVEDGVYRVYVTAVPEDGKANRAVVALLAKYLGVAKSRLEIVQGSTGRDKIVTIT